MNKDALLATCIGFGIGLVIAAFVFLGPTIIRALPGVTLPDLSKLWKSKATTQQPQSTPTPDHAKTLTIQSPLPESIETSSDVLVTGSTETDSVVVIEGESNETVSYANGDGAFAGKITLSEGKNDLVITSYSNNTMQRVQIRVYYTPENF